MMVTIKANPFDYTFDVKHTALVIIDMQRDFVEPGGFALKAPAAERLIIKLREAIDRPRDPRLDAPAAEATPS